MDAHAGWYQDPWGQETWRWWDGREWTTHTNSPAVAATPAAAPVEEPERPGFLRRTVTGIRERREAARAAEEARAAAEKARLEEGRLRHKKHKKRVPGTWLQYPTLRPVGWDRSAWQEVVGESHYQAALEAAAQGRCQDGPVQRLVTAQLLAEPTNEHDPNAVQVRVGGHCVGYIPRTETARFHPMLHAYWEAGVPATCRAWIKGGWDRGVEGRGSFGIDLDIRVGIDGSMSNFDPEDGFLPDGFSVTVVGEEHCQDTIAKLPDGRPFLAELVEVESDPLRPKVAGPIVLVMAAGGQVGALTPKMSARYLPLIRDVVAAGLPATCQGAVEAGPKKLEVKVGAVSPAKISSAYTE